MPVLVILFPHETWLELRPLFGLLFLDSAVIQHEKNCCILTFSPLSSIALRHLLPPCQPRSAPMVPICASSVPASCFTSLSAGRMAPTQSLARTSSSVCPKQPSSPSIHQMEPSRLSYFSVDSHHTLGHKDLKV